MSRSFYSFAQLVNMYMISNCITREQMSKTDTLSVVEILILKSLCIDMLLAMSALQEDLLKHKLPEIIDNGYSFI